MRYRSRIGMRRHRINTDVKKNIATVIIIIVFGIIIFSIGTVGEFLARNVFVPLFGEGNVNLPVNGGEAQEDSDQAEQPVKLTESVTLNELSMFLVQTDVFESKEEGAENAKGIAERGGAGYIIEDGHYRVFAAAYNTQKQAQSVCEQLIKQGEKNSKVYPITSGTVVFKITAGREQIDAVREAFDYYPELCRELAEKTIEFDKGQITATQYKTLMATQAQKLNELTVSVNKIINGASENSVINGYLELLETTANKLENISVKNSVSGLVFSSEIKYNYIELAHMYIDYVQTVKA